MYISLCSFSSVVLAVSLVIVPVNATNKDTYNTKKVAIALILKDFHTRPAHDLIRESDYDMGTSIFTLVAHHKQRRLNAHRWPMHYDVVLEISGALIATRVENSAADADTSLSDSNSQGDGGSHKSAIQT